MFFHGYWSSVWYKLISLMYQSHLTNNSSNLLKRIKSPDSAETQLLY